MSLTRVTKKKPQIPASVTEMEALALQVLELGREREALVRDKAAAMEAAAAPFTKRLEELEKSVDDGMNRLSLWAEANRPLFGEARSLEIAGAHRIGWRLGNWKTAVRKGITWKAVQELLVNKVRDGFNTAADLLRTKTEVNKEAMIERREDPDVIHLLNEAGVDVQQEETFYID